MSITTASIELKLRCWDGYDDAKFIADSFAETGVGIRAQTLISDHQAAADVLDCTDAIDILNINNPYPKKVLHPAGRVIELDNDRLIGLDAKSLQWINSLEQWSWSDSGKRIGICQRFGSFNLVVNTNRLSREFATDTGFKLVHETGNSRPYGILLFPEFNIFHICIAADLNPFHEMDQGQLTLFEQTARLWFDNAAIVTEDSQLLNNALINGDIDYFLSGGVFTTGAARLAGHENIACITPTSGPIDGKGAISFMEVTAVTSNCRNVPAAYRFLDYLLKAETASRVAMNPTVCNPVSQMADPKVFSRLPREFLGAIQWDSLEEDLSRCAVYDIPPNFPELQEIVGRVRANQ